MLLRAEEPKPPHAPVHRMAMLALLLAACGETPSEVSNGLDAPTPYNVVLVTLDGVRWQELFGGTDPLLTAHPAPIFNGFWSAIAPRGQVYGNQRANSRMRVTNIANASLPGYTSIYALRNPGCVTNFCGKVKVPTFVDRLKDELGVPKSGIAVFASWSKMKLAVTSRDDVAVVEIGPGAPHDDERDFRHPEGFELPAEKDRVLEFDRLTAPKAFAYLERERPRYLHIAMLDSDRFAHQKRYGKYVETLEAYDRMLVELVTRLDALGEYGRNTALIITTDHGRGIWGEWGEHGPHVPASARVWAFVMLPPNAASELTLEASGARDFSHDDIRLTTEALLGLGVPVHASRGFIAAPAVQK